MAESKKPEASDQVTFSSLGVVEGLCMACEKLGWKYATEVQRESIPLALQERDIIALAETGSGKTGAFAVPVLQNLLNNPQPYFCCVLAPTRELALQISEHFQALGSFIGVKSAVIVGGVDVMQQAIALGKKPHIVVGTPGRVAYHIENTKGFSLRTLQYLVLDEADRLLNMDFGEAIDNILMAAPKDRHTFLFSATMTSKVAKLKRAALKNPVKVQVAHKHQTVKTLVQNYVFIPHKFRDCYLAFLLNEFAGNNTIVFVSSRASTQRLMYMLASLGFQVAMLHGAMKQSKRVESLNVFKSKEKSILLATDVASRGLDIQGVDIVINYDLPESPKDYVHRVGRTARAGASGRSITMTTQYDVELLQKIEHAIGKKLELYPTEESMVLVFQERVAEASRLAHRKMKDDAEKQNRKGKRRRGGDEDNNQYKKKKFAGRRRKT